MLDWIELVFNQLMLLTWKSSWKNIIFSRLVWSHCVISANPQKVDKVRDWPVPKNAKKLHSFLGLGSYYCQFIPNFAHIAKCLHQLVGLTNVKKTKGMRKEVTLLDDNKLDVTQPILVQTSEH